MDLLANNEQKVYQANVPVLATIALNNDMKEKKGGRILRKKIIRDRSQIMSANKGGGLEIADNHWQGGEGNEANADNTDKGGRVVR